MPFIRLDITDFRNILFAKIEPLPDGFNLLYGQNGSGKTSLLEAIYYLSLGRSFRSALPEKIIRHDTHKFFIFAQTCINREHIVPIGIERERDGTMRIRIAEKDIRSTAELAELIPVQLINSHCYNLLDAGPAFRRKYLDWGIFYLNPNFFLAWKAFEQALKQRNAALRLHLPLRELDSWTQELITKAALLDQYRQDYINQLIPLLKETVMDLLTIEAELEIRYQSGWHQASTYQETLLATLDRDKQVGYTQFGPHRADLKISINQIVAKDILSRGQQKLFVCAMMLAQGMLLKNRANKKSIYLIDDLPAELDRRSRSNLITLLAKQQTQIFVTAIERELLSHELSALPIKMFHVEHGNVTTVE